MSKAGNALDVKNDFGRTGLKIPPIVFGTSCLGNLYEVVPDEVKYEIVSEFMTHVASPVALDSAGKYGAGLALEEIGRNLRRLGVAPADVLISNKLGWYRVPLTTAEPTFEPGAWKGLKNDACQRIGYEGIVECYEQGCELLGAGFHPQVVSVHDPDEYLAGAEDPQDRASRWDDILGAYRALGELKRAGRVRAVGVGSKDWRVIRDLTDAVGLDWAMFACSFTIFDHPAELVSFIGGLGAAGVGVINSAVFNAGFLVGGKYFDYRILCADNPADRKYFEWREKFFEICGRFDVGPAEACVRFGMSIPGIVSIALNSSKPVRVRENVDLVRKEIPARFWTALKDAGLIDRNYPYLG